MRICTFLNVKKKHMIPTQPSLSKVCQRFLIRRVYIHSLSQFKWSLCMIHSVNFNGIFKSLRDFSVLWGSFTKLSTYIWQLCRYHTNTAIPFVPVTKTTDLCLLCFVFIHLFISLFLTAPPTTKSLNHTQISNRNIVSCCVF